MLCCNRTVLFCTRVVSCCTRVVSCCAVLYSCFVVLHSCCVVLYSFCLVVCCVVLVFSKPDQSYWCVFSCFKVFWFFENKNITKCRLTKSNNVRWDEDIWAKCFFMCLVVLENLGNIPQFSIEIKTAFILEIWSAKFETETASFSMIFDELWQLNKHWKLGFSLFILQNSSTSYNRNE